jgi:hypothetical protein
VNSQIFSKVAVDGGPVAKRRKPSDKIPSLSAPEIAGVLHAMVEPILEDESLESRINGLANEDWTPCETFPKDCTHPKTRNQNVVELQTCIFSLGACNNMSELISALGQTSLSAHAFQPVYQHKGIAKRSTLFLRLKAENCEQIHIDQRTDVYINMDVVVWDQVRKKWGRPISVYTSSHNRWMPDIVRGGDGGWSSMVSEERVDGIREHAFKNKRLTLEAVTLSRVLARSGTTLWQRQDCRADSVWQAVGADVCVLPGVHAVSSAIERSSEGEWRDI